MPPAPPILTANEALFILTVMYPNDGDEAISALFWNDPAKWNALSAAVNDKLRAIAKGNTEEAHVPGG